MDEKKSNFFTNLITYAYKGFFATIYFLIGKKDKISEMFMLDDVNSINMDTNDVFKDNDGFISAVKEELVETEKVRFRYKAKEKNGKIIKSKEDLAKGDIVNIRFSDGEKEAQIQ